MISFISNFINKNKKYKLYDYVVGTENKFNYKFKNIDIIILNQYLLNIIKIDKIFNNDKNELIYKIINDKNLLIKPVIQKRKKKTIEKTIEKSELEINKLKIVETFFNIDKQNHNKVMTEKLLNNIYILLYKYQQNLKNKKVSDDVFYKYNKTKLYDYCKKYNIKLKKIIENDESDEFNFVNKETKNESDELSEEFFNIFGENIKK